MPCYSPLHGYRSKVKNENGKRPIVFKPKDGYIDMPVTVPCGQCIGCRLERSRQWAIRCVHESKSYEKNCFITLTYNDENLPENGSLHLPHFQKFMKRLRKEFGPGIRYFHCGEYGEKKARPHYHACLFNFDFPDKKLWATKLKNRLYTSDILNKKWGHGYCIIGDVTFDSAAYVARYILKKVTGEKADDHYGDRDPEYTTMSRRPGIGRKFYDEFKNDIYPDDTVIIKGREMKPPKYYDNIYDLQNPSEFATIKYKRKLKAMEKSDYNDEDRLRVKEKCLKARLKNLKRSYESGNY